MKLYYSGANTFLGEQKDPSKSLGGYISNTELPNDFFQSLFSSISVFNVQNNFNNKQSRLIVLKNELGYTVDNVNITFNFSTDTVCSYKFAIVSPSTDNCGNYYFEKLNSEKSIPYYSTLTDISNKQTFSISSFISGQYYGIWLIRDIIQGSSFTKPCDYYFENEPSTYLTESFSFEISWEIESSVSSSNSISLSTSNSSSLSNS